MHEQGKNEWVGIRGTLFGWLLNSPLRRLLDVLLFGANKPFVLEEISKRLPGGAGTVLDVGAGSGYFSIPIAERLPTGRVICADGSAEMLKHLARAARKRGVRDRVQPLMADAGDLGLEPGSVDVAFSGYVLHELPDPEQTLKEMHRVLKPGGSIIIIDFNNAKSSHGRGTKDMHGSYTPEQMAASLNQLGFVDVSIREIKMLLVALGKKA